MRSRSVSARSCSDTASSRSRTIAPDSETTGSLAIEDCAAATCTSVSTLRLSVSSACTSENLTTLDLTKPNFSGTKSLTA